MRTIEKFHTTLIQMLYDGGKNKKHRYGHITGTLQWFHLFVKRKKIRKICQWKVVILVIGLLMEGGLDNSSGKLPCAELFGYLVNYDLSARLPNPFFWEEALFWSYSVIWLFSVFGLCYFCMMLFIYIQSWSEEPSLSKLFGD